MSQFITRAEDAQAREYSGVQFDLLATGEETMVTKMRYETGDTVQPHDHPNEQSGYVITGRHRLIVAGEEAVLEAGDSYVIPAGVEHAVEVLATGEVIDVFVPPRERYR